MTLLRTPPGTKDVLPTEAAELRLIEDAVRTVFHEFGYGEVITPALEFEEVLELSGQSSSTTGFRLLDDAGNVLVLRPDLTTPIARLVGSRLRRGETPHRVFSVSDIFRRNPPQRGQESEFRQAGIELLGSPAPEADAEVLAVACRSLERAGLREYSLGVGHLGVFTSILDAAVADAAVRASLADDLVRRDLVGYRVTLDACLAEGTVSPEAHAALLDVPELRGGPEVLERAAELAAVGGTEKTEGAVRYLRAVLEAVSRLGHASRLLFDLGLFRNFDYYTGIVFEIYAPGVGFTLGGGGRYDSLLGAYGVPMPAVGFGIGLDRLHVALVEQGGVEAPSEPLVVVVGGMDRHVAVADALRAACLAVFALPVGVAGDSLREIARQKDARVLVEPADGTDGSEWTVIELQGDGVRARTSREGLVEAVRRAAWGRSVLEEGPR